jgi:hypothetical protein
MSKDFQKLMLDLIKTASQIKQNNISEKVGDLHIYAD